MTAKKPKKLPANKANKGGKDVRKKTVKRAPKSNRDTNTREQATVYTDDLAAEICARIADNESLRAICRDPKMPTCKSVYRWLQANPEFQLQYILAHHDQADATYEDIIEIETDLRSGKIDPATARALFDSHKWRAGKMRPKKYGDASKYTISGPDDGPIQTEQKHDSMNLEALQRVIRGEK